VLVPIAAGSEPVEASVPIDILRRAGAEVTVASAGEFLLVEAMYDVKIVADALVADCADASYDLVVLPVRQQRKARFGVFGPLAIVLRVRVG
jgi:protein deglycase